MADSKELLAKVSDVSTETEYFSPIPAGYKKGKTKNAATLMSLSTAFS